MHHHTHRKMVQATYCIHQLFSFLVFFWIEHVIAEERVEIRTCIKKKKVLFLFIAHPGNFYRKTESFDLNDQLTILGRTESPQTPAQRAADLKKALNPSLIGCADSALFNFSVSRRRAPSGYESSGIKKVEFGNETQPNPWEWPPKQTGLSVQKIMEGCSFHQTVLWNHGILPV